MFLVNSERAVRNSFNGEISFPEQEVLQTCGVPWPLAASIFVLLRGPRWLPECRRRPSDGGEDSIAGFHRNCRARVALPCTVSSGSIILTVSRWGIMTSTFAVRDHIPAPAGLPRRTLPRKTIEKKNTEKVDWKKFAGRPMKTMTKNCFSLTRTCKK